MTLFELMGRQAALEGPSIDRTYAPSFCNCADAWQWYSRLLDLLGSVPCPN